MSRPRPTILTFLGVLVGLAVAVSATLASNPGRRELNGTIWVANRGAHTIRGFDAATGDAVVTVAMRAGSQPGDLAYAKGKLYVAEEFGSPPASLRRAKLIALDWSDLKLDSARPSLLVR